MIILVLATFELFVGLTIVSTGFSISLISLLTVTGTTGAEIKALRPTSSADTFASIRDSITAARRLSSALTRLSTSASMRLSTTEFIAVRSLSIRASVVETWVAVLGRSSCSLRTFKISRRIFSSSLAASFLLLRFIALISLRVTLFRMLSNFPLNSVRLSEIRASLAPSSSLKVR